MKTRKHNAGRGLFRAVTAIALLCGPALQVRADAGASFTRFSIPRDGLIVIDREFRMKITFQCRGLFPGDRVMLDYSAPDHPGLKAGYLGKVHYFDVPAGPGGGAFTGEHAFETTNFLSDRGTGPMTVNFQLNLWKRDPATGALRSDRVLHTHSITLTAVRRPALSLVLSMSDPAGSVVLMKDSISATATVHYTNLLPDSPVTVTVWGYVGAVPDLKEKTRLARWVSGPLRGGNGSVSTPALILKPPVKPENVNWHIAAEAEAEEAEAALWTGLDYLAANFASVEVKFTRLDYVKPPDTAAVGEDIAVVVGISYKHVLGAPYLTAVIYDRDAGQEIASAEMPSPAGYSGEYTFPTLHIRPSRAGTWNLAARVKAKTFGDVLGRKQFQVEVVPR